MRSQRGGTEVEEVPWYVSLIVSWLPFIMTLLLFAWIGRRIARGVETSLRATDGRPVGQILDEHVGQMRRSSDLLEQVIKHHAARLEALERKA